MKVKDAKQTIENLLKRMRPYLLAAGIEKHQLRLRGGNHRTQTYCRAFDWLHDLYLSFEYINFEKIWDLLPPKTWERYELFEIEDLREQKLLETAKIALRRKWKTKRPRLFGRDYARHKK